MMRFFIRRSVDCFLSNSAQTIGAAGCCLFSYAERFLLRNCVPSLRYCSKAEERLQTISVFRAWSDLPIVNQCEISRRKAQKKRFFSDVRFVLTCYSSSREREGGGETVARSASEQGREH